MSSTTIVISTPRVNGKHFCIDYVVEEGKGFLVLDSGKDVDKIAIDEAEFKKLFDICGVTDHHIEHFGGRDFTPTFAQSNKIFNFK